VFELMDICYINLR